MVDSYVVVIAPDLQLWLAEDSENAARDGVRVGLTFTGALVAALAAGSIAGPTYMRGAGITWRFADELLSDGSEAHNQLEYAFQQAERVEGVLDRYAIAGYLGLSVNFYNVHGRRIFLLEMVIDILTGEAATTTYYEPPV